MTIQQRDLRISFYVLIASSFLVAAACTSKAQNGARPAAGAGSPAVPVVVADVVRKDIPVQVRTIGRVEAYSTVAVKAQVTGEITAVLFREGQDVKQGDVLFMIDPQPYEIALRQAQAILDKDRAQMKEAEAEAARYKDLVAKEYVTREQYDKILSGRDVLAAAIKADEAGVANARLQLERCTVRSPIEGRTGGLLIYRGNLVRATDASPALVINQVVPIRVTFSVPERDLPRIKEFMGKGDLKAEALVESGGTPAAGILTFIDNAVDRTTGTITLKATFANADRSLWPGQFVNVVLTLTIEKDAVVVPSQAVQSGQSGLYLFVVKDDMTVDMRRPKIDRIVGGEAVVAEGVKPGEKVVTDGLLQLVPGARVQFKAAK
jgi:multidrug efflux system membrane fusion protein